MKELHLTKKDFKIDWFSGTGAGGQYRNKHQNCCRITHLESGLVSTGQTQRDRISTQREAFTKLANKVIAFYNQDEKERRLLSNVVVRTYHFERGLVSDGNISSPIDLVMDGWIDEFISHTLQSGRKSRETGRM